MKLQNILFPSIKTCTEEGMYFRRTGRAEYYWGNSSVKLHKGDCLHFDTYFNGFSAEKWMKYTNVEKVRLVIKIKGDVRITLLRKEKTGSDIEIEYINEEVCHSEEATEYIFEFKTSSVIGMYCFSLCGEKGISEFFGGYYSADIPKEKKRKVKIAVDICTFKREKFVERNLLLLNHNFLENPESELYNALEIFISDNAGTLNIDRLSSKKIHIVKNKNVGGAGGFTRGLIEIGNVAKKKSITHVLLMDDDILIEPESVFRTFVLLSCVKEQYYDAFVGGAMLRLDRQNIQVESGAVWAGGDIISLKHGLNLIDCDACLYNEIEENAQYNAWWYCVFPIDVVTENNLPLPIFIRGDDVEYGLRNMKHLILMNGICVWHEPFEKKYSSFLFYYILRNRLIDNALHKMTIPRQQFIRLLRRQVVGQIILYRYKNAMLLMKGVEDFLKGVNWLARQDGEELHKEIMGEGYKLTYLEELEEQIPFVYAMYEDSVHAQNPNTLKYRVLRICTVNGIFHLPAKDCRPYNIVPVEGVRSISVYRTNKVLNYDYSSRKGFLTYKDRKETIKVMKQLRNLCRKLRREYDAAVKDFEDNGKILMSRAFWEKYLRI